MKIKNKKIIVLFIIIVLLFLIALFFIKRFNSPVPSGWYLKNTYYYEDGAIGDYFSFYIYQYDKELTSYKNYKKVGNDVEKIKLLFNQNSILSHYKDWLWDDNTFDEEDLYYLKEYKNDKYDLYYFNKETKELFLIENHCD